jgi:hypothetical protein
MPLQSAESFHTRLDGQHRPLDIRAFFSTVEKPSYDINSRLFLMNKKRVNMEKWITLAPFTNNLHTSIPDSLYKRFYFDWYKELKIDNLIWGSCYARTGQNRVTWKTPSRAAFVPLQEPVAVLASYVPYTQMPRYETIRVRSYTTFISCRSRSWVN